MKCGQRGERGDQKSPKFVPYTKSNANTFVCALLVLIDFPDLVSRDQPRGARSDDPSSLGQKILYELASLKYCYVTPHLLTCGGKRGSAEGLTIQRYVELDYRHVLIIARHVLWYSSGGTG